MNFEEIRNKWKDLNRNKLPDVTASDNGKVAKVVSGDWATGDDNDEKHLLITITESSGTYTADKSFSAIKTAITNKQEIDCRLTVSSGTYQWFALMGSSSSEISFYAMFMDETVPKMKVAKVTSDGWTMTTVTFPTGD